MKNTKNVDTSTNNSNYILYSVANYKPFISNSVSEILNSFVSIITEYMRFISEKVVIRDRPYFKFIFERGIETLIHIFTFIFYYTKNLELTFYHTQKAYYFYVEFIEQMSDDTITFLKLGSRDAILFVYKKTIFDINNEYKKNIKDLTPDETSILCITDSYIQIYKTIIQFIINNANINYDTKIEYINNCCNYIQGINDTLTKTKYKDHGIGCMHVFINKINDKQFTYNNYYELVNEFIKKIISKKKLDEIAIKNKIYELDLTEEYDKICPFIFSEI
jgi:hypothetical protein